MRIFGSSFVYSWGKAKRKNMTIFDVFAGLFAIVCIASTIASFFMGIFLVVTYYDLDRAIVKFFDPEYYDRRTHELLYGDESYEEYKRMMDTARKFKNQ